MDRKKVILLSAALGLALAVLAGLVLFLAGGAPQAEALSPTAEPSLAPSPTPMEEPGVAFSFGRVAPDTQELVLPSLLAEDVPLLNQLTSLRLLDGRACDTYSLLQELAATAPYEVIWSVSLGGLRIDSDSVAFEAPEGVTAEEVAQAIRGLPALEEVDLRGSSLTNEQVAALREEFPQVSFSYYVLVQGKPGEADATQWEIAAADITDWEGLARELGYLTHLERIVVTGDISVEQAAFLLEGAAGRDVVYQVRFNGQSLSSEDTEMDAYDASLSHLGEVKAALAVLPKVRLVHLTSPEGNSKWTLEEADQLQAFREGLLVDYTVTAFGVRFSLADEVVSFSGKSLKRKLGELRELLPYLKNVQRVDMENCGIDNETMAALKAEFPAPKLVWRVRVGSYSCRTDSVMLKFSAAGDRTLSDSDVVNLKYCTDVKYLDLGHNKLHHMPFAAYMPELEVCIMYNPMIDIVGIENCPKLEYFECFSGMLKDLTPLSGCTELKHLNICYNKITDITPLYGLTKLERLWLSRNDIPREQIEHMQELVPDCLINTTTHNPTEEGWRRDENGDMVPRYALLFEQFRYKETETRSY